MFALQLLRILETIPSDVSMYESSSGCASSEQDMTISPSVLNDCWNPMFLDEYEPRNSTQKEFQHPKSLKVDAVLLSYSDANHIEPEDSKSPSTAALTLIETCNSSCADQTVLECDTPELMVCYKDINYHVMKDICIDEGTPLNDKKSSVTTDETESDGSIEDSFIDPSLPIQEFGTRSFLRSFIISLDDEGNNKTTQMLDQISSRKAIPASSAESDLKEAMLASSSFSYNSKVKSTIITFNFNSRAPEKSRTKEPSVDSRDKLDHKNSDSHNLSYSTRVHCQNDACNKKVHEESIKVEDVMDKNDHNQLFSVDRGDDDSFDVGLYVPEVNDDLIKRDREKHGHGETSFSDAGFITHSGQIPFSGSISFRSDSSATSGKSFTFPVLQSEWNSSPVRMTTAERRHFRKHKFWRSGLLCCRF